MCLLVSWMAVSSFCMMAIDAPSGIGMVGNVRSELTWASGQSSNCRKYNVNPLFGSMIFLMPEWSFCISLCNTYIL